MNKRPTYAQQYDKLAQAYINCEVDPFVPCGCFCGNLLNKKPDWVIGRESYNFVNHTGDILNVVTCDTGRIVNSAVCVFEESEGLYDLTDILELERTFMATYMKGCGYTQVIQAKGEPINEDALFAAFEVTLEKLKELHIAKGEVIDETPAFVKRELAVA